MGMFDSIKVLCPLPLTEEISELSSNWRDEVFQTKDLDCALSNYRIEDGGRLRVQSLADQWAPWGDETDTPQAPTGEENRISDGRGLEMWEDSDFTGDVLFYTSFCDCPLEWDYSKESGQLTWEQIVLATGSNWWVEFKATIVGGQTRNIVLVNVKKTKAAVRLASMKELAIDRENKDRRFPRRAVIWARQFEAYREGVRLLRRAEQAIHSAASSLLLKL